MYPGCSAATLSPRASYSSQVVGDRVAELVEQCLVVPEQHGREVVTGSVHIAVDGDGVKRAWRVAVEPGLVAHAQIERCGEGLNAILLVGRPAGIVHLRGPHDVGPAFARLVEQRDLGVERVAAAGVTVVGLQVDLAFGVVRLERLDDGRAGSVDPDGDRAVSDLLRGGEAVLAASRRASGFQSERCWAFQSQRFQLDRWWTDCSSSPLLQVRCRLRLRTLPSTCGAHFVDAKTCRCSCSDSFDFFDDSAPRGDIRSTQIGDA